MQNESIFFFHILFTMCILCVAMKLHRTGLSVFVTLGAIFANFFVLKQITLFGLTVTSADVYVISGVLSLALLEELYGKEAGKQALYTTLLALIFFLGATRFLLSYTPVPGDLFSEHYEQLLCVSPRIIGSSIFAYFVSSSFYLFLLGLLRKNTALSFNKRTWIALVISQLLDTSLYSSLALWNIAFRLDHIIFMSFVVKITVISLSVPLRHWVNQLFNKKDL